MATFRCLQSGQTVTFVHQHDIDSMKGHAGYVRLDEEQVETYEKPMVLSPPTPVKKLGRPKKVANV
jgi:hypothetical protein|tara:strand:- start:10 stop:207 length:198 start_codon:yes stop_codon:yes gene_type:complete